MMRYFQPRRAISSWISVLLKSMPKEKNYSWFWNIQSCLYIIMPLIYQRAFKLEHSMWACIRC